MRLGLLSGSDDKHRRLNSISHILSVIPYESSTFVGFVVVALVGGAAEMAVALSAAAAARWICLMRGVRGRTAMCSRLSDNATGVGEELVLMVEALVARG
jgi:hypothetical protein